MGQLERDFQPILIKRLYEQFPGCIVIKNDPTFFQGFPDLTVLYKNKWAALEVKKSSSASKRPNQSYYVEQLNKMSYAAFVNPENMEDVIDDLQRTFRPIRKTRVSESKQSSLDKLWLREI